MQIKFQSNYPDIELKQELYLSKYHLFIKSVYKYISYGFLLFLLQQSKRINSINSYKFLFTVQLTEHCEQNRNHLQNTVISAHTFIYMTKPLRQVQQKIKYLKEEIHDVLELASLNNQSIICLASNKHTDGNVNYTHLRNQSQYYQQGKRQQQQLSQQLIEQKRQLTRQHQQQSQQSPTTTTKPQLPLSTNLQTNKNIIFNRHSIFQQQINSINQLLQKRTQNHLNYLIVRQIQGEQESVRRDRLNEYQEKIYDQRRIISDKQVFLQNLYRPKKQRPDSMTSQKFQQLRIHQRAQQQKVKQNSLDNQIKTLTQFHQMLSRIKIMSKEFNKSNSQQQQQQLNINDRQQQHSQKIVSIVKGMDLQRTKAHSLETVNLSAFNNLQGEKQEGIMEQTQLNNIRESYANNNAQQQSKSINKNTINTNSTNLPMKTSHNSTYKLQLIHENHKNLSLSQNNKPKTDACYSIPISKLINDCERELKKPQGRARLDRIKELLRKIQKKKDENNVKIKQLREMQIQNAHMHEYVLKVRKSYLAQYNQCKNLTIIGQNHNQL